VNRLDAEKDWEILDNDNTVGWLRSGKPRGKPGTATALGLSDDGALEISLELNGEVRILARAVN
jgi:hypothetical protein